MVWLAAALSIITDLSVNTTINRSVHRLYHPHTSPLSSSSSLSQLLNASPLRVVLLYLTVYLCFLILMYAIMSLA
ncbi:hypothetical protein MUK42_37609 [Musa troglodytarum]|uniref:Uncharacterized protein n=1 Tax=Musa troglodytarum TaxID=320322 RepID=A0A9E7GD67_9LILI|nr:hypothetical protein MUK42_37609 [Musa troglodytarum]